MRALVRGFDALLPFDPSFNAAVALWREIAATPEARLACCPAPLSHACLLFAHAPPITQEHRGMLLESLNVEDVQRTWVLVRAPRDV